MVSARAIDKASERKLLRALKTLEEKAAKRVAYAGIRAGSTETARAIRREIPSDKKGIKKAIGSRFERGTKTRPVVAKAGAAVGKKSGNKALKSAKGREGKPGVGISAFNVHWWIMGTAKRFHASGKSTGRMPMRDVVRSAAAKAASAVKQKTLAQMRKTFKREVPKAKAR